MSTLWNYIRSDVKVQAIMKNHHRSEDSQCNSHSPCVRRRKRIAGLVPPQTEEDLSTCSLQTWESYWPYLRYRLLSSTLLELTDIYQMTEGIESRMKTAAATADSFEDFVSKVKQKDIHGHGSNDYLVMSC